VAITNSNR